MGSEMCIRDRPELQVRARRDGAVGVPLPLLLEERLELGAGERDGCLLYTSDAADERSSVDLGGRRIIKKKNKSKW